MQLTRTVYYLEMSFSSGIHRMDMSFGIILQFSQNKLNKCATINKQYRKLHIK